MASASEPQHAGKHTLGPHVIGQRVVVRRVLRGETGPSGGPAMTDLLGVCTAWGDGVCVVQPETGDPVPIQIADIVSGKPVPPRPSTRHRMTPLEAQTRALALFPDLHTEPLGSWTLRHSETSPARRANSVLAFGPSDVADDYDRVVAFYRQISRRPIAAVLPDSLEDELFRSHGWGLESHDADTTFQLASVARASRVLRSGRARPTSVELVETTTNVVTARIGDLASGTAAYADDWVGFRAIEVSPAHRRQGLGMAIMAALLDWGAERGASTAYLQVLGDNTTALAMYERLGFTTHHTYRYLAPGPEPAHALRPHTGRAERGSRVPAR